MTDHEFMRWAEAMDAAGHRDAFGHSWRSWLILRRNPDGSAITDQQMSKVYETQSEFKARGCLPPVGTTLELFA